MLPFGITDLEFALVTFASAFIGIALVVGASRLVRTRYLAAFSLGVYLWFFTDTLGGANYLNVGNGFVLSSYTFVLFLLFAMGLVFFFSVDNGIFGEESVRRRGILIAALAALALGLHGFGEGADFGSTAAGTPFASLFDAIGGLAASASWVLHKMLEPTLAGVCYVAFAGIEAKKLGEKLTDVLALAAVFVTPPVLGSIAGYYVSFDTSYGFALGLGASVYVLARVGKALYGSEGGAQSLRSAKVALSVILGFLFIFISALLHS